jgi:sialic acid synthase SpsE
LSNNIKYIAEIGVNHLGDENKARRMVEHSIQAGADAVTFQIQSDDYYDGTKSFRNKLRDNFYSKIINLVHSQGKEIGIALTESDQVSKWLDMGVDFWKVLSMDIGNHELLKSVKNTGKEMYISTGIASDDEIKKLYQSYSNAWYVHTTLTKSSEDANISALSTIRSIVGDRVGYGLHAPDPETIYFAVAYNASFIFFYVIENDDDHYPDYEHSIEVDKLADCLIKWRESQKWIGSGKKNKQNVPEWTLE